MNRQEQPLAHWTYTTEEWNAFVAIEKKNKKEDNIYFGIGILILATLGLVWLRGTSLWMALLFSVPFSVLLPLLRQKFSYPHLKKGVRNPTVTIYPDYVIVNGRKIELASRKKRIKSTKIINAPNGKQLLEIDIQWMTGKGPTNDEFRFLIPDGELSTAEKLVGSTQN